MDKEKVGMHNETSVFAAFDLVPSLITLAKIPAPANIKFDGENLAPVLLGKSVGSRSNSIMWRRPPDRKTMPPSQERLPDLCIREGDWKLLCEYDGSLPQLYNLSLDRAETENLATKHPDRVNNLAKALLEWNKSMPADNGHVKLNTR